MQTYQPMLDYCTMTSFLPSLNERIASDLVDGSNVTEVAFSGYRGIQISTSSGGVSLVEGTNNAGGLLTGQVFKHYMVKFSGEMAEYAPQYYVEGETKVTRIDVQVTCPSPGADYLAMLETKLRFGNKFNVGRGRRRGVTLIRSDTSTLYYGSRNSDLFWRAYDKQDEDGKWYIRWEFECKGRMAEHHLAQIAKGECNAGQVFLALAGDTHEDFDQFTAIYKACCRGEHAPKFVRTTERSTMDWLEGLTPTVERMLTSHQHGNRMRALLGEWDRKRAAFDRIHGTGTIALGNFATINQLLAQKES